MPRTPVVVALFVFVTLAAVQPTAQRQTTAGTAPRLADTVVPGVPGAISIDLPANVFSAQTAFRRILEAAGVRYGLEGPAWDPNVPPIDLAQTREESAQLSGRRLGEALDVLVKAVPQFRWTEVDGLIIVRATPAGQGVLDRQIARFTLTDAPPRVAMEAIITAIDPTRPRGLGLQGFGRPGTGAGTSPEKTGRNVTLNLTNVTLQTVLSAIARANGAMTWTVQYDRAPASLETATIALTEYSETVTAQSPAAFRDSISTASSTQRMPIASSMTSMLSNYAVRNPGLKLSVEEVATPRDVMPLMSAGPQGVPPLELPDSPALAIARIVALDSRYEWSQSNGRFRVRPKPGVPGRIDLLDAPVNGFTATTEAARSVIERAGRTVGMVRPAPTLPAAIAARGPTPIDEAMATPISVSLAGPVTPRDIFDAIADATGWSWSLRPNFMPGQPSTLSLQWRGRNLSPGAGSTSGGSASSNGTVVTSVNGANWSTSIAITATVDLSPTPMPSRPPVRPIPAGLDRGIPQMLLLQMPGSSPFLTLVTDLRLPLNIEEPPPPLMSVDPRRMTRPKPPIVVGPGKFSDALYVLMEKVPGYEVVSTDGVVNVAASALLKSSDYFMNRPLATFSVTNVGLFRAVGELRRALDPKFEPGDWTSGGAEVMNKPVSLSVRNASPREILNGLARQHGNVLWMSTFAPRTDRAEARVADWIVTLTPISAVGPIASLAAAGGVPASALQPRIMTRPLVGGPSVALDLPVTSSSLRVALSTAMRTIGTPLGLETVATDASSNPLLFGRSTDYYDLTGLSAKDMMDKLQVLAPEYEFGLTNGVCRIRPREAQSMSTPWLDQRVARFEERFENLRDAMQAVATLGRTPLPTGGRGGFPARGMGAAPPPPVVQSPGLASMNDRLQKTLAISLTDVTVRDILDEISRQFGRVMWVVEQRNSPQGNITVGLTFTGYDGWSTGTSVR